MKQNETILFALHLTQVTVDGIYIANSAKRVFRLIGCHNPQILAKLSLIMVAVAYCFN